MTPGLSMLARNDVPSAIACVERALDAGTYSTDDAQSIVMLQDEPGTLTAAYAEMMKRRVAAGRPTHVVNPGAPPGRRVPVSDRSDTGTLR